MRERDDHICGKLSPTEQPWLDWIKRINCRCLQSIHCLSFPSNLSSKHSQISTDQFPISLIFELRTARWLWRKSTSLEKWSWVRSPITRIFSIDFSPTHPRPQLILLSQAGVNRNALELLGEFVPKHVQRHFNNLFTCLHIFLSIYICMPASLFIFT